MKNKTKKQNFSKEEKTNLEVERNKDEIKKPVKLNKNNHDQSEDALNSITKNEREAIKKRQQRESFSVLPQDLDDNSQTGKVMNERELAREMKKKRN